MSGSSLAGAVLAQARRSPDAVAVLDGDRRLRYADLAAGSAAIARSLIRAGVGPGHAVAVHLPRGWHLICAMLAILRLGATVVPLDRQSPPERQRHMLRDSAAVAVVHGRRPPAGVPDGVRPLPVTTLLAEDARSGALPEAAPEPTAFVFYTSGTTGCPKGVEVRDAGILRLARPGYLDLTRATRYASLANPAFDAISFEVWAPLLTGGCCVVIDDDTAATPDLLAAALRRERIDTLFITVALFNAVVDEVPDCFAGVGQVLVGGEQLNAPLIRRWYRDNPASGTQLYNVYGPTEATTFALCYPIPRDFHADVIPIGRVLPGTGAHLVVDGDRLAGPGEVAELYLSGEALAAGYRNLPAETAERFVRLSWLDGGAARHYRTGDLVRADAAGLVTYVGRVDRQVKVRGFRVEPGEVERQILRHPAVRQAYVCTRRAHGVNELVAYVVVADDLTFAEFDRHLTATLPPYLRPHRVHRVPTLPLTTNGKVDAEALLRRDDPPWRGDDRPDAPVSAWQQEVLALAGEVLGVPDLRPGDRWIASGGDSLTALRLRFEIQRRWGREVPQSMVLDGDLAGLADALADPGGAAPESTDAAYPVPAAPAGARSAPATSEQQRLWLLHQRPGGDTAYHVPLAFSVRGRVDLGALRQALCGLVARHPALRTAFHPTPSGLRQVVADPYDPWGEPTPHGGSPSTTDGAGDSSSVPGQAAGWRERARALCALPFDLAQPRLLRAYWLPNDDGGVLLLHLHHIAVDGWSLTVLFRELSEGYAAALAGAPVDGGGRVGARSPGEAGGSAASPPGEAGGPVARPPVGGAVATPLDFAAWQEEWFRRPEYRRQRAALQAHYAGLDPAAEPLPPVRARRGSDHLLQTAIDPGRRAALDRLGAELGLTRFPLLLTIFAWAVYGVTGRTRLRVAAPVANRPLRAFADSVGMFANTVLLPLTLVPGEELRAQLVQQAAAVRPVLDAQDVVLAHAVADHDFGADTPLFDLLFVLDNTDFAALSLPGCRTRPVWLAPTEAKCPLTLSVVPHEAGFDCLWEYADDHFDAADIAAMAELFLAGLDAVTGGGMSGTGAAPAALAGPATAPTAADDRTARQAEAGRGTLAALVRPYRAGLAEPGRGRRTTLDLPTIAEEFARQVAADPGATALVAGDRRLSYADLDGYAAGLAAQLTRYRPTARRHHVALYFAPSVEHIVALLAAARLNLTAVPLDRAYPPALLREVLTQLDPLCVLLAPGDEAALEAVDGGAHLRHPVRLCQAATPVPPRHAGRPLYTLFTSGSTGTPKGVNVSDALLVNLLRWQRGPGGLAGRAATLQFSMLSFDVSFQEIFGTLCGGGTLHLPVTGLRQDLPALLEHLDTACVERLFLPYVALQLLAEHGLRLGRYPSRLREVVTAGEQLICTDSIRRWFTGLPGARLFNHYGPTETHVVSAECLDGDPAGWPTRPAIGRPVDNMWLRVVDDDDQPVPPDCPGHLLIGGELVAPCYLRDAALDRARFVALPGAGWFFRSGDRARFDRDGRLHYLGREDQQVKVSGHRLELGQVEAALLKHPAVVNAVVVREQATLVACLQFRAEPPAAQELTAHLRQLLPAYVRVDRFRALAELPRTASGKLDRRRAATAPGTDLLPTAAAPAAMSPLQARLARLFEEVIGVPIGLDERLSDRGAGSLGLMRLHLRCVAEGLPLTIPDFFEHVTIGRLAAVVAARSAEGGPAAPEDRAGHPPAREPAGPRRPDRGDPADEPIAVVGMAVRLPGADDLAAFWAMVEAGERGISHFEAADGLVGARSQLAGLLAFDPGHFGISPAEARLMDPQQRHLLTACVEALAHAGIATPAGQRIGLLASCGENTYFQTMLRDADPARLPDSFQLALHHEKDFLATKVAYHLGLTGPAFAVQAACSSSLVAVHIAAGLLRQGDSEVMLVGGVLVDPLLTDGYRYRPQHIFSPDGHCRPFSDDAGGTVGGSGVAVVVLKPLWLARRDGDTVYAVITGSAVNNDGAEKLGYTAPSVAGQREVIRAALRRSGRDATDVGYVEAHGTATELGDPVEVAALRQAYGVDDSGRTALASVKSQIGHLGAAAGLVGLVRAVLAIHHGLIPPNVDFNRLNPRLGADPTPFYIPTKASPWPVGRRRVAAVSSFGIGGTNAHLICEAPEPDCAWVADAGPADARAADAGPADAGPADAGAGTAGSAATTGSVTTADRRPPADSGVAVLLLSGSSAAAVRTDAGRIADYLAARPETYPQVLRHLQAGRPAGRWRAAAVCAEVNAALAWLRTVTPVEVTGVDPGPVAATGPAGWLPAAELVAGWLAGHSIRWPPGPAQPPWDFPPPAFAPVELDFVRAGVPAAPGRRWPARLPEAQWLHQPHWVRWRHAAEADPGHRRPGIVVIMAAAPPEPATTAAFAARHARIVGVTAGHGFGRLGPDRYRVDPADPEALRRLLAELTADGPPDIEWLHALPLAVNGPVGSETVTQAYGACVDTPAALLAAVAALPRPPRLRTWWLSSRAQPVLGEVDRPELGLLAGVCEVAPQEGAGEGCWLDLPEDDPATWAAELAALLAGGTPPPRRLALRDGYWWEQVLLPVASPTEPALAVPPAEPARYVVLGGTGGIGSSLAAWLLNQHNCRVVLLARSGPLPASLAPYGDRVDLIEVDLTRIEPGALVTRLDATLRRVDGIVHAAGSAAGALIGRRDAAAMRRMMAGRMQGALAVERLVAHYRPSFAVYCSSMSAQFGGVGQLDYAATNGLLDGFARHRSAQSPHTSRISIGWDIWREVGMAVDALPTDARHRAHLAVGLDVVEGGRVFARALRLRLPQLLVCTTPPERAREFYAPPPTAAPAAPPTAAHAGSPGAPPATAFQATAAPAVLPGAAEPPGAAATPPGPADLLTGWLRERLGVDRIDPSAPLDDLGADSLLLLDLIDTIREDIGVSLTLAQLGHRASLTDIIGLLGGPAGTSCPDPTDQPGAAAEPDVTVQVWQTGRTSTMLCLVHPVGGDARAYRSLAAAIEADLTICVIADPGLTRPEAPDWSLADRATRYHDALRHQFPPERWRWLLGGWSYGAWVALEMAARAEATGHPADRLYLLDPPLPQAAPGFGDYDQEQLAALFAHELGAAGRGGTAAAAYADALARCCRANLASLARHTPARLTGTPAQLWLASHPTAGLPPPEPPPAQAQRWRTHLPTMAWQSVDTTHYGIVAAPHVATVAAAVTEAVRRS